MLSLPMYRRCCIVDVNPTSLRPQLAIVPQSLGLFTRTQASTVTLLGERTEEGLDT